MVSLKGLTAWMLWCTWTHVAAIWFGLLWAEWCRHYLTCSKNNAHRYHQHDHDHHFGSWWRVTCVISRWIVNDGCWLILTTRPYFHGHCYLYHHYLQCELFHIRHNHIDLIARVVCLPARLVWFWQIAFPLGRILATDSWKSKSGATTDNGDDDDDYGDDDDDDDSDEYNGVTEFWSQIVGSPDPPNGSNATAKEFLFVTDN